MKAEKLFPRIYLFTNGLKKGFLRISIEPDVLYLDLHKKRLKPELTLWGHKYFLKCHNGHQPPHSEMRGPHRHSYLFTFASLGSIGVYYPISALLGGV